MPAHISKIGSILYETMNRMKGLWDALGHTLARPAATLQEVHVWAQDTHGYPYPTFDIFPHFPTFSNLPL